MMYLALVSVAAASGEEVKCPLANVGCKSMVFSADKTERDEQAKALDEKLTFPIGERMFGAGDMIVYDLECDQAPKAMVAMDGLYVRYVKEDPSGWIAWWSVAKLSVSGLSQITCDGLKDVVEGLEDLTLADHAEELRLYQENGSECETGAKCTKLPAWLALYPMGTMAMLHSPEKSQEIGAAFYRDDKMLARWVAPYDLTELKEKEREMKEMTTFLRQMIFESRYSLTLPQRQALSEGELRRVECTEDSAAQYVWANLVQGAPEQVLLLDTSLDAIDKFEPYYMSGHVVAVTQVHEDDVCST